MNDNDVSVDRKKKIASIVLVWMIAAAFLVIVVPMETPVVKAITHLDSAAAEDAAGLPYDIGPMFDGVVLWDPAVTHDITLDYTIQAGYELNVPAMGNPVNLPQLGRIIVETDGRLVTNADGSWMTKTTFTGPSAFMPFDGIYFYPGSEGNLFDVQIQNSINGAVFQPGSTLLSPGISDSAFVDNALFHLQADGVGGVTNIQVTFASNTYFDDSSASSSTLVSIANSQFNISDTNFISHAPGSPQLHINNADVTLDQCTFYNDNQAGNSIFIEGNSNGTYINDCDFFDGATGDYFINSEGNTFMIENTSFDDTGDPGSIEANEDLMGTPSHITILNPTGDGLSGFYDTSFDKSSMNATGGSSLTLQWYKNVQVIDPDLNPINNAPVWILDVFDNPASPASQITDITGWTRWFTVTDFVKTAGPVFTSYNPHNISAENATIKGYINPEETIDQSMENIVTVPFNPVPNNPPTVSNLPTPGGIQAGSISISFRLSDLDVGDDGNLSITVRFWDPITSAWKAATADPLSDMTNLNSGVDYTFIWVSNDVKDFAGKYHTDVKIEITPWDKAGPGTPLETGIFTVDNVLPQLLSAPVVTSITNTTAQIDWTVDENCDASVWYGLDPNLNMEQTGTTGSTTQTVTLTGLLPGRIYTFHINSTDMGGNVNSSDFAGSPYTFDTEIHIPLYTGWNMMSFQPILFDFSVTGALSTISGDYDAVQMYDPLDPTDPWKHYVDGKLFGNDLTDITTEGGIWILMNKDAVLIPDQAVPPVGSPAIQVGLEAGWNFIGYPSVTTRTVSNALSGVTFDMVQYYDSVAGKWEWSDGSSGGLLNMEVGKGYWIHVPSSQTWFINYL
jgi:hypothetical protein